MRIVQLSRLDDVRRLMAQLKVDAYGIDIMAPKALGYLIRLNNVSALWANILKQEMLSLGADAALPRSMLSGAARPSDCLLIGSLAQFSRLAEKLKVQPFGLKTLAAELTGLISNYQKDLFTLSLGTRRVRLGRRTAVMGIVNLTPDSFSGDGLFRSDAVTKGRGDDVVEFVERQVKDGADIIDIGGESSRPGARRISVKEELSRTIPVLKRLAKKIKVPLSIDTYKPDVAREALDNGASLVNDISGLRDKRMARIIARARAAVVIMHMRGVPATMQEDPRYASLFDELIAFFRKAIAAALDAGIAGDKIIIDPGIGFGKSLEHNCALIRNLAEFKVLGKPILAGVSRKSFIGTILNEPVPQKRVTGSVAGCVLAAQAGAHIVRVHDVKEVKAGLRVFDTVRGIE